jgi:hypothetical protein
MVAQPRIGGGREDRKAQAGRDEQPAEESRVRLKPRGRASALRVEARPCYQPEHHHHHRRRSHRTLPFRFPVPSRFGVGSECTLNRL